MLDPGAAGVTPTLCAFCGWKALHRNEDGTLNCDECCVEWSSEASYEARLAEYGRFQEANIAQFYRNLKMGGK